MREAILLRRIKGKVTWSLKYLFRKLGIGISSDANLSNLQEKRSDRSLQDLQFIRAFAPANYESMINPMSKSKSQLRQDLFVLFEVNYKRGVFSRIQCSR